MIFQDLDALFQFVFSRDQIVVYGDLGRLPHVVVQYLSSKYPNIKVLVHSNFYRVPIPNNHSYREIDSLESFRERCDLLILAEPTAWSSVRDAYPSAGHVLILTSHAVLSLGNPDLVAYFHAAGGGATMSPSTRFERIRRMVEMQEGSEEHDNARMAKNHISHPSVLTVGPGTACDVMLNPGKTLQMPEGKHFIVVDLTTAVLSTSMFLNFWDAFDYMAANIDSIDGWSVCFCEGGKKLYEDLAQECIDRLHCSSHFQKQLKDVLPLLPFYKSGTIDKSYNVPVSNFVRHRYVAPETLEDAFKASMVHDVVPLVGGVYSIFA